MHSFRSWVWPPDMKWLNGKPKRGCGSTINIPMVREDIVIHPNSSTHISFNDLINRKLLFRPSAA